MMKKVDFCAHLLPIFTFLFFNFSSFGLILPLFLKVDDQILMFFQLMNFARGKIMMALEGGYNLKSLSNSVLACVNTLLGQPSNFEKIDGQPFESTWRVIRKVIQLDVR